MMSEAAPVSVFADRPLADTICLFDVDGPLTPARKEITPAMEKTLAELRKRCVIGFVSGSDLNKQVEQLGPNVLQNFDFCFSENGLTAHKNATQLASQSFINYMGEERYKMLVNFILRRIADLNIPIKRGTFIEFRSGMINISPIGRNCSHQERNEFEKFDLEHRIRENFVFALQNEFPDYGLTYSIGGQISFDVFPAGWDKTYCLRHLEGEGFKTFISLVTRPLRAVMTMRSTATLLSLAILSSTRRTLSASYASCSFKELASIYTFETS